MSFVRVRWHLYDDAATRVEWLQLPRPHMSIHAMSEYISSTLREREDLPPDSLRPGERVLWFEWDCIRRDRS